MIERIGVWEPSEWPAVGDEKILPYNASSTMIVTVTEVFPGSHIVAEGKGRRFRACPRIILHDGHRVEAWDFEEITSAS